MGTKAKPKRKLNTDAEWAKLYHDEIIRADVAFDEAAVAIAERDDARACLEKQREAFHNMIVKRAAVISERDEALARVARQCENITNIQIAQDAADLQLKFALFAAGELKTELEAARAEIRQMQAHSDKLYADFTSLSDDQERREVEARVASTIFDQISTDYTRRIMTLIDALTEARGGGAK